MTNNGTEHSTDETVRLTPEQMAMVREADAAYERGEQGYTPEQVMQRARAKVKTWTQSAPVQSR